MNECSQSKVLIVDDKQEHRYLVFRILESLDNIEFVYADSGEAALKALLSHSFAVILLDVHMPGMNGYETAELISSDRDSKDTPIIMVTAQGSTSTEVTKAYDSGATDYIFKPVDPKVLLSKVKQFVALDQALQNSSRIREQRDRILNAAGEGVIEVDAEGTIQYCNLKACSLLGSEATDVVSTKFDFWFNKPSDDKTESRGDSFHSLYNQVKVRGFHQQCGMELKTRNGDRVPAEMN